MSSISKDTNREISSDAQPSWYPEGTNVREVPREDADGGMTLRFKTTAEVIVSKIFPAGFGWQSSSILAEEYLGYAPDTAAFALTTGLGDALGVLGGHCAYFAAKKSLAGAADVNLEAEAQTGLLLAGGAFCSGTAWQPLVAALQAAELDFAQVLAGTWLGCGVAFYAGLRAARVVLRGPCRHVAGPGPANAAVDMSLSLAIGGATGFFVGTDTAYLPHQNFLIDVVGIRDGTSAAAGCVLAGTSTSLGFLSAQTPLNALYPTGKLWTDGK